MRLRNSWQSCSQNGRAHRRTMGIRAGWAILCPTNPSHALLLPKPHQFPVLPWSWRASATRLQPSVCAPTAGSKAELLCSWLFCQSNHLSSAKLSLLQVEASLLFLDFHLDFILFLWSISHSVNTITWRVFVLLCSGQTGGSPRAARISPCRQLCLGWHLGA